MKPPTANRSVYSNLCAVIINLLSFLVTPSTAAHSSLRSAKKASRIVKVHNVRPPVGINHLFRGELLGAFFCKEPITGRYLLMSAVLTLWYSYWVIRFRFRRLPARLSAAPYSFSRRNCATFMAIPPRSGCDCSIHVRSIFCVCFHSSQN